MADNDDHEDYDDLSLAELADDPKLVRTVGSRGRLRPPTKTLAEIMIQQALTPEQVERLRRDRTVCMVIEAPSEQWVEPLASAAKRLGDWQYVYAGSAPEKRGFRSELPSTEAVTALANGGRTLGVSQNPHSFLPKAMTGSADIVLTIRQPSDEVIREAIKAATGRSPRSIPTNVAAGLDYAEVCAAIRVGSSAKACVERLAAASKSKAVIDPNLAKVPDLDALHGYDEAMEWCKALVADLEAWRRGELAMEALDRCSVFSGPPGTGKTTLVRSLAKSAGIPLIATSMSERFANGPGYLDSVIKQIDLAFNTAAAVAPAILFIDEIDGIPNRAILNDERGAWWIPVVGHILLKLDSAASGANSRVIVIGATNHPEKLDPALVRPGRLNRLLHIGLPDVTALEGILRQHLSEDLAGEDLKFAATLGEGATGADVTGWVKAARRVARQENRAVTMKDLLDQVAPADERPPEIVRRVATHEAAHAVVMHVLRPGSVTGVSVIGRNGIDGGHTDMKIGSTTLLSHEELEQLVTISLAGRAGEQALLGSVTSGAGGHEASDLGRATYLLGLVHASLGMGGKLLHRAAPQSVTTVINLDPLLAKTIEADLQRLYAEALRIVEDNVALVQAVAHALVKHRHLTGAQFLEVCERHRASPHADPTGDSNGDLLLKVIVHELGVGRSMLGSHEVLEPPSLPGWYRHNLQKRVIWGVSHVSGGGGSAHLEQLTILADGGPTGSAPRGQNAAQGFNVGSVITLIIL